MSYYVYVDVDVIDPEGLMRYATAVAPMVEAAGGAAIARAVQLRQFSKGHLRPLVVAFLNFPPGMPFMTAWNINPSRPFGSARRAPLRQASMGCKSPLDRSRRLGAATSKEPAFWKIRGRRPRRTINRTVSNSPRGATRPLQWARALHVARCNFCPKAIRLSIIEV